MWCKGVYSSVRITGRGQWWQLVNDNEPSDCKQEGKFNDHLNEYLLA